jgi:hypothetical protein
VRLGHLGSGRALGATAATLAVLAACCPSAGARSTAAVAQASPSDTGASIRPSLRPDRLGASTALTLAIRFSGGAQGVPAPLRRAVLHLPAGLGIGLRGVKTCAPAQLRRRGAAGCPTGALVGRGHALLEARTGSLTIPEEAEIWVFRGPDRGSKPVLEIYGRGETPLVESTVSAAVLEPDSAPYGTRLTVSVPAIPTLTYEPDASFVSLSVTVGAVGRAPRAHAAAGAVLMPRSCPAGGFPFAASFAFADGSSASASATVACP